MNALHKEILQLIQQQSGVPTQHTFLDSYLGNNHPRYAISMPKLRSIAKEWMKLHRELTPTKFTALLTSLVKGISSTEKIMVGILLDYASTEQRKFDPKLFNIWLNYLQGWAEVDAVCTGKYTHKEILEQWTKWKPLLNQFSKSKNIQKRRASIVLLCAPVRKTKDHRLATVAFINCTKLSHENEILITKAISWVLRSMVSNYKDQVEEYLNKHENSLPKIAVRETRTKLKTGKKTKRNN